MNDRQSRPTLYRRALTLVEMLIAIALIGVLLGAAFLFWTNLNNGRGRIRDYIDRNQAMRVFLDRLQRDTASCLVGDAVVGSGVRGDESSLTLLTRSVDLAAGFNGEPGGTRDLQQMTYRFDETTGTLSGSRSLPGVVGASTGATICDNVGLVRFRYHDGRGWRASFDSWQANQLPVAIEVAVWFDHPSPPPADATDLEEVGDGLPTDVGSEFEGNNPVGNMAFDESLGMQERDESQWPEPDRLRVIIIPDGPEFQTSRSFEDVVSGAGVPAATGELNE